MAHTHVVTDSDAHFIIDPITRAIKKEESAKVSLIVGDHNSERFSFELPRYIEGHDMSLCNVVRVHYINTSSSKTELQNVGVYEVDDFGVMTDDDTKMGLSWLISNNVTKYVGKLAFTIQFACMTGYRVDYSWQTGVYSSMSISEGINGSEIVFDEYADILRIWWERLYATSTLPIEVYTQEQFKEIETKEGVLYLLEDDPTLDAIQELQLEHGDMKSDIEANTKSVDSIREDVKKIKNETTYLDAAVTTLRKDVDILQTDTEVGTLREDVDSLSNDLDQFKMSVNESLVPQVKELRSDLSTVNTNLAKTDTVAKAAYSWTETNSQVPNRINELETKTSAFYTCPEWIHISTCGLYSNNANLASNTYHTHITKGLWLIRVEHIETQYNVILLFDTSHQSTGTFFIPNKDGAAHNSYYHDGDGINNLLFYVKSRNVEGEETNADLEIKWVRTAPISDDNFIEKPNVFNIYGVPFGFSILQ